MKKSLLNVLLILIVGIISTGCTKDLVQLNKSIKNMDLFQTEADKKKKRDLIKKKIDNVFEMFNLSTYYTSVDLNDNLFLNTYCTKDDNDVGVYGARKVIDKKLRNIFMKNKDFTYDGSLIGKDLNIKSKNKNLNKQANYLTGYIFQKIGLVMNKCTRIDEFIKRKEIKKGEQKARIRAEKIKEQKRKIAEMREKTRLVNLIKVQEIKDTFINMNIKRKIYYSTKDTVKIIKLNRTTTRYWNEIWHKWSNSHKYNGLLIVNGKKVPAYKYDAVAKIYDAAKEFEELNENVAGVDFDLYKVAYSDYKKTTDYKRNKHDNLENLFNNYIRIGICKKTTCTGELYYKVSNKK